MGDLIASGSNFGGPFFVLLFLDALCFLRVIMDTHLIKQH